jgi:type II secretory pathway component PulM
MLAGLTGFLVLLAIWFLILAPLAGLLGSARTDYDRAARIAAAAESLGPADPSQADDRNLRTAITEEADRRSITYTRINSSANGGIDIDLVDVPHTAFFSWLTALDEAGIIVEEAYVTPGESDGRIEARVSLRGGGQ